jgi:hypothetical protein
MSTAKFTDVEALALFCSGLVKAGIAFAVIDCGGYYLVEMTGY